jgi:hypothetical protein
MPRPPFRRHLAQPSIERVLLALFLCLIAVYAAVLLVQPSGVGRGGR